MEKTLKKIAYVLIAATLMIACKSTQDKVSDFVQDYNKQAVHFRNAILTSTRAKVGSPKEVILNFTLNLDVEESEQGLYKAILPDLAVKLLTTLPAAESLVKDGVVFKVLFLATDKKIIDRLVIDEAKLSQIKKAADEKLALSTDQIASSGIVSTEMAEMLNMLNANLPYEDKETGIKVMRVSITNSKELKYDVEVPGDLEEVLKMDMMLNTMKQEVAKSGDFKTVLNSMRPHGITKVKYVYLSKDGSKVNEMTLTRADL